MMRDHFNGLVTGIEKSIEENPEAVSPRKRYTLEVARLGTRLYSEESKVAWCGIVAPFDILNAMGITSCFVEFIGAMLASTGVVGEFMEEAEHSGYAPDICAYHRSVIGAAMKGLMPVPEILIATTCPCTGGLSTMENLSRIFEKEMFILNIPNEMTAKSVEYLADQLRDMVSFVEAHTGEKLEPGKLALSIEKTNRARELLIEVYDLASRVPSPATSKEMGNFGIVMPLFFGTDGGIEVAETYRDTFRNRVEMKKGGLNDEQQRLIWIQNRIQFKNPIINMMEENYGAAVVIDELNDITWGPIDPGDPYPGIAKRCISIPFNGSIQNRIEHIKMLSRKYSVDGAVFPGHWGCRQGTGSRGLIEAGLKDMGIPMLNLDMDCVDTRNYAGGQVRTRVEAFMETLGNR